jgi:hypothetical protein
MVETAVQAMADGRKVRSHIRRLKNYGIAINAAKSDEVIRPIADACSDILALMTDGKEFDEDKITELLELHSQIERMCG